MNIVQATTYTKSFGIGRQGENLARQVVFDLSDWITEYCDGTPELIYQRPGDKTPYPVAAIREGSTLLWTVTSLDTAVAPSYGSYGRCELRWYVGDVLAKSQTWRVYVEPAMNTPAEMAPPDPEQGWVDQVLAAGAEAQQAAKGTKAEADRAALLAAEVAAKAAQTAQDATAGAQAKATAQTARHLAETAQRAAEKAQKVAEEAQAAAAKSATDADAAKHGAESALSDAQDAAQSAKNAADVVAPFTSLPDDVNQLKQDMVEYESKNGFAIFPNFITGFYINYNGDIKPIQSNWKYSEPIQLSEGDIITVKTSGIGGEVSVISTCNSDGSNISPKVVPSHNAYINHSYTATSDCYVIICGNYNEEVYITVDRQTKYNKKIDELYPGDEIITEIYPNNLTTADKLEVTGGYYIGAGGSRVLNELSKIVKFPCNPLTQITICYQHKSPGGGLGIAFKDSSDVYISNGYTLSDYVNTETYNGFKTWTLTTPNNAAYAVLTSKLGTSWDCIDTLFVVEGNVADKELIVKSINGAHIVDEKARNEIDGLKQKDDLSYLIWCLLGDSLTEKTYRAKVAYYDWISQITGINILNIGSSGKGYARWDYFYNALSNVDTSAFDFMTIFGSGNDLNISEIWSDGRDWETALGHVTDNGPDSLCGYINRAIDKFYEVAPLKKLGIITPTPWASQVNENGTINGTRMDDYASAIVNICKMRGIPCLDLFHCSGLRPWDEAFRIEYYNENGVQDAGVHPNSKGHKWISKMILEFIRQYLI